MKLKILGSSSGGNCYLLETGTSCLIIEAGVSFSEAKKALDFNIRKIQGVIISHAHQDHSKYTKEYLKAGINVYALESTLDTLNINYYNTHSVEHEKEFYLGMFRIMPFELIHDVPCLGYLIKHPESGNIVFITDSHYSPYRFVNINHWLIEANYDQNILDANILKGSIPQVVRNRVMKSHISIQTCKELLKANDLSDTMNIVLLHLSDGNSDAEGFKKEIEELTGRRVTIADKGIEISINKEPF